MSEYVSYGYTVRCMVWSNSTVLQRSIYMGCDEHLYRYKVEDDTYVYIGSVASDENIKRLWIDGDNLYGAAWEDPSATVKTVTARIISYDGTDFTSTNTISTVFTGEYCYRDGGQNAYHVGGSPLTYNYCQNIGRMKTNTDFVVEATNRSGENLLIPFSQYIDMVHASGQDDTYHYSVECTGLTATSASIHFTDDSLSTAIVSTHSTGYHSVAKHTGAPSETYPNGSTCYDFDLRFSLGQYGFMELVTGMSPLAIVFTSLTESSEEDQISYKLYNIGSDTVGNISLSSVATMNNYKINSVPVQSTCCTVYEDDIYFGGVCWYDGISETANSRSYIIKVSNLNNLGTGGYASVTTLYQSTGDTTNVYRTFLDMKYANYSVGRLFVTYLNRDNLGKGNFGGFGVHSAQVSYDYFSDIKEFFSVPTGLVVDNKEKDGYYTLGSGSVYQFDRSTNLHILADSGNPFVDGESYQSSNLCVIPLDDINVVDTDRTRTEDIIFGVSAPFFPNETQAENIMGKYYLWKLDNYISDRVELADFEGMNVWGALTQLAQLAPNYTMGFDLDDEGSFFLTSKTNSTYTTTLTVSSDPDDKNLISIDKDRGLDEIFNYVAIVPTAAMIQNADKQLYLSPRTEDEKKIAVKVGDILVDIVEKYAIYSKSICIREGNISVAHSDVKNCAIFKFQTVEREIEAVVVGDVAAGGLTITVASTFRGGESTTKLDENGATVNNYIKEAINLNDYFTFINPDTLAETNCRITNISDTSITIATAPGFAVASGTVVVITHPFYDGTDSKVWSSEGVTTVVPTGGGSAVDTIYVTDTRDLSANCIIGVHSDSTITYVRVLPDDFGVYYAAKAGYTLKLTGDTVTCGDGTVISAYYSPSKTVDSDYDYFEIGGSGVSLRINPAANTSNVNFKSGDRITIKTEGMKLENLEQAKQIALDSSSIATYGRIEYTGINNKFLSRALAKQYVKLILNDYKNPKYILTVETLLSPTLAFRDTNGLIRIKIFDKKLFPKYSEVIAYPRSITHNLRAGTTSLVVRDNDAY